MWQAQGTFEVHRATDQMAALRGETDRSPCVYVVINLLFWDFSCSNVVLSFGIIIAYT
jgi:hypothetical protein